MGSYEGRNRPESQPHRRVRRGDEVQGVVTVKGRHWFPEKDHQPTAGRDDGHEYFSGTAERLETREDGPWVVLRGNDGTWPVGSHKLFSAKTVNFGPKKEEL